MAELLEPSDLNTGVSESTETIIPDTIEPETIVASSEDGTTKEFGGNHTSGNVQDSDIPGEGHLCPLTGLIIYSNESGHSSKSEELADVIISSTNDTQTKHSDTTITDTPISEPSREVEEDRPNCTSGATDHLVEHSPEEVNLSEPRVSDTPVPVYNRSDSQPCEAQKPTTPSHLPPISTIRRNLSLGTHLVESPSCFTGANYAGEPGASSTAEFYNTQGASTGPQSTYYSDLLGYVPDFTDLYHQSLTSLWQPYVENEAIGVTHPSLQPSNSSEPHTCPSQPLGTVDESIQYQSYQPPTPYNPAYAQSFASRMSWSQNHEPSYTLDPPAQAQASYQGSQNDNNPTVQTYYHQKSPARDYTKPNSEICQPNAQVQLQANTTSAVEYAYYPQHSAFNKSSNQTRSFEQTSRGYAPQTSQTQSCNQPADQSSRGYYVTQSNQPQSCQSSTYNQPSVLQQATSTTRGFAAQPNQSQISRISSSAYVQHITKTENQSQEQLHQKVYGIPRLATQGTSVLKQLLKSPYDQSCESLQPLQRMVGRPTVATNQNTDEIRKFLYEHQKAEQPPSTQKPNIVLLRQATSTIPQTSVVSNQLRHYAAMESQQNAYNAARANMSMLDQIEQLRRQKRVRELMDYQRYRANNYSQPQVVQQATANLPQRAQAASFQVQPAPAAKGLPPPYCVKWSILNEKGMPPNATNVQRNMVPQTFQLKTQVNQVIANRPPGPNPTQVTVLNAPPRGPIKTMLSTIVQSLPPFKEGKVNAKDHKPRHYDMTRLEIGAFLVEAPPEGAKKLTSRIKVLFTRRRFVYEFELNLPKALISGRIGFATALFCVHVPFITIDVISCQDNLLRLLVNRQPEMYFGTKNTRAGSTSTYDTTQRVDVTSGEMARHPLHKIYLKKNQAEKLKSFLCNFDQRFIRMLQIPIVEPIPSRPLPPATPEELESLHTLPPVIITRVTTSQQPVQVPDAKPKDTHIRVMTQNVQIHPQLKRPTAQSPIERDPIPVKQAKSSESKRSIRIDSKTPKSQHKKSSPEVVEQLRNIRETPQIAGIVKLPELEVLTTSPKLVPAQSPIDLTTVTDTDEPGDSCSCRTSCRSQRCACAKDAKHCSTACSCNNCDNPLNILEAHAVNVEEAMKDTCLNANIYKVMHLEYYLNRTIKLGCCQETVRYLDCIPGVKNCPNCNEEIKYSWCRGIVCLESKYPRSHCEICNKCAFLEHQLYCLCHKSKKPFGSTMDNNSSFDESQD